MLFFSSNHVDLTFPIFVDTKLPITIAGFIWEEVFDKDFRRNMMTLGNISDNIVIKEYFKDFMFHISITNFHTAKLDDSI